MIKEIKQIDNKIINIMASVKWNLNISGFLDVLELSIYPDSLIYERKTDPQIYEENRKFLISHIKKIREKIDNLYTESKERRLTFRMIKGKKPDFCGDINSFLTKGELAEYELGITKYLKYMTKDFKNRNKFDSKKDYKRQYQEKIYDVSQIIDSPLLMKVGNMQDRYVLQQLNSLSVKDFSKEEYESIIKVKKEVNSHIEKYGIFLKEKEKHTRKIDKEEIEI